MELPRCKELPKMARVRQHYPREEITNIEETVAVGLERFNLDSSLEPGARIGITVGSRGAGGTAEIVKAITEALKGRGFRPFIIPAMGSHGGATPDGQRRVLEYAGVSEETIGVPIDPRMETVVLARGTNGYEAHYAVAAQESDAVIVFARATVHPSLKAGEGSDGVASGLLKTTMVGLGKQGGAQSAHHHGLAESLLQVPDLQLQKANIIGGISLVENAYRRPYRLEFVPPVDFKASDRRQLKLAQSLLGRIPFRELDVLVVDRMGKDIAGSGLDPNVIGWRLEGGSRDPNFRRVVSLSLTPASLGNATGIGLNDFVTQRLVDAMDSHNTWMNILTASSKGSGTGDGHVPMVAKTDREAIELALGSVMPTDAPRVCHIRDTGSLEELLVSEALLPLARDIPGMEVMTNPSELSFDSQSTLQWV